MTPKDLSIEDVLKRKRWRRTADGWRHRALEFAWPAADAFRLETEADNGDYQARKLLGREKGAGK